MSRIQPWCPECGAVTSRDYRNGQLVHVCPVCKHAWGDSGVLTPVMTPATTPGASDPSMTATQAPLL